ncbi:hypothetical protein D9M70_484790 [compost metagenome]
MKKFRIWWLKRRLARQYTHYMALLDTLPCGSHMGEYMPSVARAKARCNRTLGRLAKLGSNCLITRIV